MPDITTLLLPGLGQVVLPIPTSQPIPSAVLLLVNTPAFQDGLLGPRLSTLTDLQAPLGECQLSAFTFVLATGK